MRRGPGPLAGRCEIPAAARPVRGHGAGAASLRVHPSRRSRHRCTQPRWAAPAPRRYRRDLMDDAHTTREKLLDKRRPACSVSGALTTCRSPMMLREAGQRNASAVHYYFGNRNGVFRALLARHVPLIAERRLELIDRAMAHPTPTWAPPRKPSCGPSPNSPSERAGGTGLPADRRGASRLGRTDDCGDPEPASRDGRV